MAQARSIHLDDFSPVISYSPAQDGWNAVFPFPGSPQPQPGAPATNSSHVTSLEGAGLTISWTGTSVALHGASTGPFDVILDNATTKTFSRQNGILFAQNNMDFAPHTIQLAAHSTVTFTGADVGVDSPPAPPDAGFQTVNPSDWTFSGDWHTTQTDFPDGSSREANECTSIGGSVSLTFEGAALHLTGFVSPRGGLYNVTLDSITTVLNASAPWTLETTLFFQTGLDFRQRHTLTVTNAEGNRAMSLRAVAVGEAPPRSPMEPPPPPNTVAGLPQGTGIALIVGAVVAFICLLVFIFLIWRHYHRRNQLRRLEQARIKEIVDFSSEYLPPPVPPPSLASARRRPPPLPLSRSSRTPSSLDDYDSRVASPELPPSATPSLRMKLAKSLLPHLRDGSSSSGHSGRRSYLRSIHSLSQQYVYDSRDRDDIAFNTTSGDPDADFRVHDEPIAHDPADDFEIDADAIFNALSKAPRDGHEQRRRRQDASFLEFTNTTSSSEYGTAQSHSARTSSMIRSMTASEITGTDRDASSSIPYFTPAARANRRSSLSQTISFSRAHHQESRPMEMTFPRSKKGVISFAQTVDSDPPKTPSEMVPRSISPPVDRRARLEPSPYPQTSSSAMASAGHGTPSEQYYSVASGMHTASTSGGDASSGRRGIPSGQSSQFLEQHTVSESGRRAIPSGESSQLLDALAPSPPAIQREPAHHEQSSSFTHHDQLPSSPPTVNPGSPVPSSLNIRGEPSPSTAPPPGPPPPLPHPFSMVGPSAPTGAPPVQVQVLPASPVSPGRRSPSPPPWPLPTRTHKERVLRKLLGGDSQPVRPPVPDFDRRDQQ
ncbi:hypothetical protein AURDEDRAFT_111370 [Auricularia subglabra TFB-10046 SS5]|nr:hypothetical protein AURDEDRAFT_111370 [Auricularia subglabra TFB-10046 SS5]